MKYRTILFLFLLGWGAADAQKNKAVLFFNDGTSLEGLGKIISHNRVKFKSDNKAKPVKYHFSKLERVDIYYKEGAAIYVYVKLKYGGHKVMEELSYGDNAVLYKLEPKGFSPSIGFGFSTGGGGSGVAVGGTVGGGQDYFGLEGYYIRKGDETEAIHLGSKAFDVNFKKAAIEYFKDCEPLVAKIKSEEWKFDDIVEIVNYYNKSCK
ncbi:MAG: hypothetical protein HRT68_11615 [Flavobacteriaceae bacterium]|nr:hypothetical protein [Flavobacteriaceae bacterium]